MTQFSVFLRFELGGLDRGVSGTCESGKIDYLSVGSFNNTGRLWFAIYGGVLKWGSPQIIHFHGVFPYKPTILG